MMRLPYRISALSPSQDRTFTWPGKEAFDGQVFPLVDGEPFCLAKEGDVSEQAEMVEFRRLISGVGITPLIAPKIKETVEREQLPQPKSWDDVYLRHPSLDVPIHAQQINYAYLISLVDEIRSYLFTVIRTVANQLDVGGSKNLLGNRLVEVPEKDPVYIGFMNHLKMASYYYGRRVGDDSCFAKLSHPIRNVLSMLVGNGDLLAYGRVSSIFRSSQLRNFGQPRTVENLFTLLNEQLSIFAILSWELKDVLDREDVVERRLKFINGSATPIDNDDHLDWRVIRRITEELSKNAIKYGQNVSIHFEESELGKRFVFVNDGPAIPADFDPFQNGARAQPGIKGTGFGLSMAREEAELSDMEITYTSEEGRTEFSLWISRT